MAKLDAGSTFQRLRNRYRLVVMNDDTYEEVVTFRLSRLSVYIGLSTVFVVLVGVNGRSHRFYPLEILYTWLWQRESGEGIPAVEICDRFAGTAGNLPGSIY